MRKKIVAGNWKMNLDYAQAMALVDAVMQLTHDAMKTGIILAPPFPYLSQAEVQAKPRTNLFIAAQNCSDKKSGAFTGEVSASMLASIGVDCVIIGHSERRALFGEAGEVLAEKVKRAIENSLQPIFCCGESLDQRTAGMHLDVVSAQLRSGLFHLSPGDLQTCIVAYEPVWAIGTGVHAKPEEAQEMHAFIRQQAGQKYGSGLAENMTVLYGGSVTSKNAGELFSCKDVDGGLVGGASLRAEEFVSIVMAMEAQL